MMTSDDHNAHDTGEPTGAPTVETHETGLDDPYVAAPMTYGEPGDPAHPRPLPQGAIGFPRDYWRKFITGSIVFVGGSYVLILALTYVGLQYPALNLNAFIQPPQANVLVLSGLTWENLIFFVAIFGLWLLVQRLGLMPRPQPYTPQPRRGAFGSGNPFRAQAPHDQNQSSYMTNGSLHQRNPSTVFDESNDSSDSDERDDRSE